MQEIQQIIKILKKILKRHSELKKINSQNTLNKKQVENVLIDIEKVWTELKNNSLTSDSLINEVQIEEEKRDSTVKKINIVDILQGLLDSILDLLNRIRREFFPTHFDSELIPHEIIVKRKSTHDTITDPHSAGIMDDSQDAMSTFNAIEEKLNINEFLKRAIELVKTSKTLVETSDEYANTLFNEIQNLFEIIENKNVDTEKLDIEDIINPKQDQIPGPHTESIHTGTNIDKTR